MYLHTYLGRYVPDMYMLCTRTRTWLHGHARAAYEKRHKGMGKRDEEHGSMLWMYVICMLYVYSTSYPVRLV